MFALFFFFSGSVLLVITEFVRIFLTKLLKESNSGTRELTLKCKKIFSLPRVVPCFPLLGLTPSGLFMGLSSTIIYTSELILWFHYLCSQCYAAQHSYVEREDDHRLLAELLAWPGLFKRWVTLSIG